MWVSSFGHRGYHPGQECGRPDGKEILEDRLAPAAVSDGGSSNLSIVLGANENLAIIANGSSYTFSSNQNFTATTGANPANQATAFNGFSTPTLTLTSTGISQYSAIQITD
jgi:hypothetical protein